MVPILIDESDRWLETSRIRMTEGWQKLLKTPVGKILEGNSLYPDIFTSLNVLPHIY